MIREFDYRFTDRQRDQREIDARMHQEQGYPLKLTVNLVRTSNNATVDRILKELDLTEDSTIADLRRVVTERLAG
jgi:hypothetical protein